MAVTVNRSDRYPVGTSVSAYPGAARQFGGKPGAPAVETHVVASDGSLGPFTTLTPNVRYVLYAEVSGENRYIGISDSTFVAPGTLKERLQAKREAVGA